MNAYEAELCSVFFYDPSTGVISRPGKVATYQLAGRQRLKVPYKRKTILAHRLAWLLTYGKWPQGDIDHINGDESDNRLANLRDVPKTVNQQNKRTPRADNHSGFLGVHLHSNGRAWVAQIKQQGRTKYLGIYKTPEQAHEAYVQAKRLMHPGCTI